MVLTVARAAGILIVLDLVIYILPARLIYKLKISRNQKLALFFVFSFGSL